MALDRLVDDRDRRRQIDGHTLALDTRRGDLAGRLLDLVAGALGNLIGMS